MKGSGNQKLVQGFFVIALLLVGVFFFFRPTITSGFKSMQSDPGDTVFNNYVLEHSFLTVFDKSYNASAWSPSFFYPQPNVLTYGDNIWGAAPFYWLARIFFPPDTSFQVWMIIVLSLSFISFYFLARKLKANIWFSAITAFIFAFGLSRMGQVGHQQLMPHFFAPMALLFLFRFIDNRKIYNLFLFEIFLYLQLLAGIYLGWFFILSMAVFIPITLIHYDDKKKLRAFFTPWAIFSYAALFFILAVTFQPYHLAQKEFGKRPYYEVKTMIPQLTSYFTVSPSSIFYDFYPELMKEAADRLPMKWEHQLFLGFFLICLVFASLASLYFSRPDKKVYKLVELPPVFLLSLTAFLIITIISFQFKFIDYSFWKHIYDFFPGAGAIRAATRVWLASYLFLLLAIASLSSFAFSRSKLIIKIVLVSLGLLACLEQIDLRPYYFNKIEYRKVQSELNSVVTQGIEKTGAEAFYLHWLTDDPSFYYYQLIAMWSGITLNKPVINGYSGQKPPKYQNIRVPLQSDGLRLWLARYSLEEKTVLLIEASVKDGGLLVFRSYALPK